MRLRPGLAIDIGTVNTLLYVSGRGLVIEEPSAIALDQATGELFAVGRDADALVSKEPEGIDVFHPLHEGVVVDLDASTRMLQAFFQRLRLHSGPLRPFVVVGVPRSATWIERRAVAEALSTCRPRCIANLVDEPVAAALGAGSDPTASEGAFIVDIGGGTTEVAVVTKSRVLRGQSLRVGGNAMDEAIMRAVKTELGVMIGPKTAERLKIALGLTGGTTGWAEAAGVDASFGNLRRELVPGELVAAALEHVVALIVDAIQELLSGSPPDLADEAACGGIRLAGGGALLLGLAERVERSIGVATAVADDPLRCVVRGAARILDDRDQLRECLMAA